jgi:hypothetical protein
LTQVFVFRPVETCSHRRNQASQVIFDSAAGSRHVSRADGVLPAEPNEVVLVVVGETEHFVRDDVPDVDNEVPRLFHEHAIEHNGNRPIGRTLRRFVDKSAGDFADRHATAAPVVRMNPLIGNRAEHLPVFLRRVRRVLAERRNYVDVCFPGEQVVKNLSHPAGAGVHPRNIGR